MYLQVSFCWYFVSGKEIPQSITKLLTKGLKVFAPIFLCFRAPIVIGMANLKLQSNFLCAFVALWQNRCEAVILFKSIPSVFKHHFP